MAFKVRIYGYRGLKQMPMLNPQQHSSDAVWMLDQPYEWVQVLDLDQAAVSSVAVDEGSDDRVRLLRIEVPDGETIRYEINPSGGRVARVADTNSPALSGKDQFTFAPGWTVSVIDAIAADA